MHGWFGRDWNHVEPHGRDDGFPGLVFDAICVCEKIVFGAEDISGEEPVLVVSCEHECATWVKGLVGSGVWFEELRVPVDVLAGGCRGSGGVGADGVG